MLKIFGFFTNLSLIVIIFLRIPQKNIGLSSFGVKSDLLGSPSSTQKFLNIFTTIGIISYLGIAVLLNLTNS